MHGHPLEAAPSALPAKGGAKNPLPFTSEPGSLLDNQILAGHNHSDGTSPAHPKSVPSEPMYLDLISELVMSGPASIPMPCLTASQRHVANHGWRRQHFGSPSKPILTLFFFEIETSYPSFIYS